MRVRILHRTCYRYSQPVMENYNEVRLQPVSDERQECHRFELRTTPGAALQRYHDLHLNLVDHFYIHDPHGMLVVEAHSEVTTFPRMGGSVIQPGFPLERAGDCLRLERCYDFLQKSPFVEMDVEVWRLARDAIAGQDDMWQAARAMMGFIYQSFLYDPEATTVHTRMGEVLRHRRGVCQDFAHVLLGMCRSAGIPARYVSGYLYVGEAAGLRGDLASHAWVEVFLPGHGWCGLDPTNNRDADEHHIKVAVGRDYADAAPLRGNFKGRATQELTVELQIQRVDSEAGQFCASCCA